MDDWKLYGDEIEPLAVGTEEEVKQCYFEDAADDAGEELYIQDPHGNEFTYDGRSWVHAL
jgi:hypothetical protein